MHDINLQDDIQEGFIMHLDGDLAKVRVAPNADCDNCGACNVVHMEILAYNGVAAKPGEKVRFTMVQENMIKISFMLFLLPLAAILSGVYAGSLLVSYTGYNGSAPMVAGAILFLAVAIFFIYTYDKKYKLNKQNFPQVIEVIK